MDLGRTSTAYCTAQSTLTYCLCGVVLCQLASAARVRRLLLFLAGRKVWVSCHHQRFLYDYSRLLRDITSAVSVHVGDITVVVVKRQDPEPGLSAAVADENIHGDWHLLASTVQGVGGDAVQALFDAKTILSPSSVLSSSHTPFIYS